jgi:hypothetical protein
MALNVSAIENGIKAVIESSENVDLSVSQAKDKFAIDLANVIMQAILSATVTVQPGIAVSTSGGAGSTTGLGTGSLS